MKEMATEIAGMRIWPKMQRIIWMREKLNGLIPLVDHLHCMIKSAQGSVLVEVIESVASQSMKERSQADDTFREAFGQTMRRVLREEMRQLSAELRHQQEFELGPAQVALFGSSQALSTEDLIKPMLNLVDTLKDTGHVPVHHGSWSSRRSRSTTQSMQRSRTSIPRTQPSPHQTIPESPSPPRMVSLPKHEEPAVLTEPPVDSSELVTMSDRKRRPAISGHISAHQYSGNRFLVTATLSRSIRENLMSLSLAQARDLRIHPLDSKSIPRSINLEDEGFSSVVGWVEACWWEEDKELQKPVELFFYICERLEEGIILGSQALGNY